MAKGYRILTGVDNIISYESTEEEIADHQPKTIKNYQVVMYGDAGWKLYGNPFLDKEGNICQAMIIE